MPLCSSANIRLCPSGTAVGIIVCFSIPPNGAVVKNVIEFCRISALKPEKTVLNLPVFSFIRLHITCFHRRRRFTLHPAHKRVQSFVSAIV